MSDQDDNQQTPAPAPAPAPEQERIQQPERVWKRDDTRINTRD